MTGRNRKWIALFWQLGLGLFIHLLHSMARSVRYATIAALTVSFISPPSLAQEKKAAEPHDRIVGTWVGSILSGKEPTPLQLRVQRKDGTATATLDLIADHLWGSKGSELQLTTGSFQGTFENERTPIRLSLKDSDGWLTGSAEWKGSTSPVRLFRRPEIPTERLRTYEGLYESGGRCCYSGYSSQSFAHQSSNDHVLGVHSVGWCVAIARGCRVWEFTCRACSHRDGR